MGRPGLVLAVVTAAAAVLAATALGSHQVPGCTSVTARSGELTSPVLDLSNVSAPVIQFETWWEIESTGPVEHDLMRVQVSTNGGLTWNPGTPATLNAGAGLVNGGPQGTPVSDEGLQTRPAFGPESTFVNIGEAGLEQDVRIRFQFDTVDTLQNGYRGWAIDDVAILDASITRPIAGGDFEGELGGWTTTGLWHVIDDAQALGYSAEARALVSLGPGDDGTLPADPDGARIAWFGEDATGTYCGSDALHGPAAQQPQQPGQQPQQPQQPGQQPQQPGQQQPRDPFPPDIITAATLDALPDPEPFRNFNVGTDDGPVFVRLPGGRGGASASQTRAPRGFIPLTQAAQVPYGSMIEASRGRATLESTADARGRRTQRSQFYSGRFQVRQPRSLRPVTEILLKGGSFRTCPRTSRGRAAGGPDAGTSQRGGRGRRVRRVWGNGRGRFRTRGRYSSATVRGTTWLTEDYCGGTLTRVARRPRTNRVTVRDFASRRTRTLRAGQSYFAAKR